MIRDFYNTKTMDFVYPEIGICMEDTSLEEPTAKIAIPILTPTLPLDKPYDNKDLPANTLNIVSDKTPMNISPCTTSNYITMAKPDGMELHNGDKVILIFIGGDINKPAILGRYYE